MSFYPGGRCGTTQSENQQFCKRRFPAHTQHTRSSSIFGAEPHINNLQTPKIFADERATYTSITVEIHSQYFFLYDKIRQLKAGISDAIIWRLPSVKSVFDSAKVARPSSDTLIEPAKSFSSPIFRTHLHGYDFFVKFYPYGIGPATGKCASTLCTLFPSVYDNLLQRPFSKLIYIGIRDQLGLLKTWTKTSQPYQHPAYRKPTIPAKTGVSTIIINNFTPHSKHFSETESFSN